MEKDSRTGHRNVADAVMRLALVLIFVPILMVGGQPAAGREAASTAASQGEPDVRFDPDADTLSVAVKDVPLSLLLARISHLTGIGFTLQGSGKAPVTAKFEGLATEAALRKIIGDRGSVVVRSKQSNRIKRVWIMATSGSKTVAAPAPASVQSDSAPPASLQTPLDRLQALVDEGAETPSTDKSRALLEKFLSDFSLPTSISDVTPQRPATNLEILRGASEQGTPLPELETMLNPPR